MAIMEKLTHVSEINQLVSQGKEKGYLTYEEVNDVLPSDVVTPEESKNRDDKRVVKSIYKLLDEADIVIGHNGDRFDLRKLRWRFISHDMPPPSPFKIIDTLKVARREFFAPSYKQDFLTKYFKLENKLSTEFDLWTDCEAGIQERLDEMAEYNKHDVIGLDRKSGETPSLPSRQSRSCQPVCHTSGNSSGS